MTRRATLAGWGQVRQGREPREPLLDPLGLMEKSARRAAATLRSKEVLQRLDGVMVVRVLSRHYDDAAKALAERLGASPRLAAVSRIGGNSPQLLVNRAAGMIARGELESVLIAGAETYYARAESDVRGSESLFKGLKGGHEREDMIGSTEVEARHGVTLPIHGFPLFETALWAESGLTCERYREGVGKLWSGFGRVAAARPEAWSREVRSARSITEPTERNRMVAFPYTKFMTSLITVDLGAAVILLSEERWRALETRQRRPVFFLGGAFTVDRQRFLAERSSFTKSVALEAAIGRTLTRSGRSSRDFDCFDLYSCFPCSVAIAQRALQLEPQDERPRTVTGGLGFFGGPGNNYSLHAIATMAESISQGKIEQGLVTSLGWFLHKHAVGAYGAEPPSGDLGVHDKIDDLNPLVGPPPEPSVTRPEGEGVIETYTVLHSRDGRPERSIIYGRDSQNRRFVANGPHDADVYEELEATCQVGRRVRLRQDDSTGLTLVEM